MSQSFVKIMLSHDKDETAFNLIPVNGGDIIGFVKNPYPHIVLNGAVHCEVNGPAYMMNAEGKTIAHFNATAVKTDSVVSNVKDITEVAQNSAFNVMDRTIRGSIAAKIVKTDEVAPGIWEGVNKYCTVENRDKVFLVETLAADWVLFHDSRRGNGWLLAILIEPIRNVQTKE